MSKYFKVAVTKNNDVWTLTPPHHCICCDFMYLEGITLIVHEVYHLNEIFAATERCPNCAALDSIILNHISQERRKKNDKLFYVDSLTTFRAI